MFKTLALTSFVLFAFMAGVIFGAKKNKVQVTHQSTNKPLKAKDISPDKIKQGLKEKAAGLKSVKQKIRVKNPFSGETADKEIEKTAQKKTFPKSTGYTVVLASFSGKKSALKHVKEVSRKGLKAFYFTTKIKGKTWHRVGVGHFPLKSNAKGLKRALLGRKLAKGSIISKVPRKIQ